MKDNRLTYRPTTYFRLLPNSTLVVRRNQLRTLDKSSIRSKIVLQHIPETTEGLASSFIWTTISSTFISVFFSLDNTKSDSRTTTKKEVQIYSLEMKSTRKYKQFNSVSRKVHHLRRPFPFLLGVFDFELSTVDITLRSSRLFCRILVTSLDRPGLNNKADLSNAATTGGGGVTGDVTLAHS